MADKSIALGVRRKKKISDNSYNLHIRSLGRNLPINPPVENPTSSDWEPEFPWAITSKIITKYLLPPHLSILLSMISPLLIFPILSLMDQQIHLSFPFLFHSVVPFNPRTISFNTNTPPPLPLLSLSPVAPRATLPLSSRSYRPGGHQDGHAGREELDHC